MASIYLSLSSFFFCLASSSYFFRSSIFFFYSISLSRSCWNLSSSAFYFSSSSLFFRSIFRLHAPLNSWVDFSMFFTYPSHLLHWYVLLPQICKWSYHSVCFTSLSQNWHALGFKAQASSWFLYLYLGAVKLQLAHVISACSSSSCSSFSALGTHYPHSLHL